MPDSSISSVYGNISAAAEAIRARSNVFRYAELARQHRDELNLKDLFSLVDEIQCVEWSAHDQMELTANALEKISGDLEGDESKREDLFDCLYLQINTARQLKNIKDDLISIIQNKLR